MPMRLTIAEIAKAVSGEVVFGGEIVSGERAVSVGNIIVTGIATDSRKPMPGGLFTAIPGDIFDGHDYIPQAVAQGAVCVLAERERIKEVKQHKENTVPIDKNGLSIQVKPDAYNAEKNIFRDYSNTPFILVYSVRKALLELAAYYRTLFPVRVVAVTGSAGKTTTKDLLAHMLSKRFVTKKTEGNFNNEIGVPLTVFNLEDGDEVLVLEMGMNHWGEISALSRAARPDMAVITNIGEAHIENLGSREGILQAKMEITEGMDGGTLIVNGEDALLRGAAYGRKSSVQIYLCEAAAVSENIEIDSNIKRVAASDIRSHGLLGTDFLLHTPNESTHKRTFSPLPVHIKAPGSFMVMNALLSAAAGFVLGMEAAEIIAGIESFAPVSANRMAVTEADGGFTVVNDTYNANPTSVRAALDLLAETDAPESRTAGHFRRVAILGDMLELGANAERFHREIGAYAAQKGIDLLVAIGVLSAFTRDGYVAEGGQNAVWYANKENFIGEWRSVIKPNDLVLVKASRGMAFEEIIKVLTRTQLLK